MSQSRCRMIGNPLGTTRRMRRRLPLPLPPLRLRRSTALALLLAAVNAATGSAEPTTPERWRTVEISSREIRESSGLVKSRTHEDVYWTHNDSGDAPRFFAIDEEGTLLATYHVPDAHHVDWEDVAIDDSGHLYLGDVGNNWSRRRQLSIYQVTEPDPSKGNTEVAVEARIRFSYADQEQSQDRLRMNFDSEAIFWRDGGLFVFSKDRSDTLTRLYRLDPENAAHQRVSPIAVFDLGGGVRSFAGNTTAADITPDGRRIALLTYSDIHLFRWPAGADAPVGPVAQLPLAPNPTKQAEAIAWNGNDLVIGNEQRHLFFVEDPFPQSDD